ncbi:pyroglutamyl-peptidase I [Streptococcus ruminantium]|uniref:pyroglutamyl-peptidase I n=1 Tax=Streptococcus ruminantium TaxID=1917441 RepID=UPI00280C4CFF|nr:pyroglutamyl-peptidase I [Streptococcus ruminantium]MDQ8768160.1 pyroglutamyl-peptidase I [Streptococcus ruminantium]MDQ8794026.1 pyroglutamyl-peptidase I [Streptococcus ruminantium]MDQ8804531.1 pyroglutamyl-peptidase I [Streptococcus ruminantium]MDQ8806242.1 pyroglutamyl-peptidase I [Streptococcus ruminantium]MDQ8816034.1 pyroglutamyl-peptidase I [Streptococcus ruminantium]
MKILVTGFDPFGGDTVNPALEVIKRLPKHITGAEIIVAEIPTVFYQSACVLEEQLSKHLPDAVLCLGQAGGRMELTFERVAINQDDARIPDNAGQQPIDTAIRENGAPAYFSTLPIKAMVEAVRKAGIPASVSNTAGTFVCNHLMYQSLYLAERNFPQTRAGFLHIPFIPEQVISKSGLASMSLEVIVKGVQVAIETIVEYAGKEDMKIVGGATH